jgi:hypothetical protein
MNLKRKHKIYAALLGLGSIGVLIDRVFILPQEASAARPPADTYAVPPTERGGPDTDLSPADARPPRRALIADELDDIAAARQFDLSNVPDGFTPSLSWRESEAPPDNLDSGRLAVERFKERHKLTGVMASGDDGYAIIDGSFLFIGQVIDGFKLVSVRERSIVLESRGGRIELALPDKGVGPQ